MKNLRLFYCMVFFFYFYCVPTSDIESYNSETLLIKLFMEGLSAIQVKVQRKKEERKNNYDKQIYNIFLYYKPETEK